MKNSLHSIAARIQPLRSGVAHIIFNFICFALLICVATLAADFIKIDSQISRAIATGGWFWLLATTVRNLLIGVGHKFSKSQTLVLKLIANAANKLILFFGLVAILGTIGVNMRPLLASLGLTSFALGFALKDSLTNAVAGLMLIFYQPFKVNQYIKVSGLSGQVRDINLRYTVLSQDDNQILVPNSMVASKEVVVSEKPLG